MCPGYNTNRKFYGIHQILILLFMFPWLKEAFNLETKNKLNDLKNAQSQELQLIKIKRFYDQNKQRQLNNSFRISTNTIIRTQDSRANGAKYLNETELPSNNDCLEWCLKNKQCNLAVYEEKNQGSCYLFDCGSPADFKCKFTKHNFYTSSILEINRESSETKNSFFQEHQHENDLVNLRLNVPINLTLSNTNNNFKTNLTAKQPIAKDDNKFQTPKCQQYQFGCKDGTECIAIYNVCDGIKQCGDGSDEAAELHCPDPSNQINQLLLINSKPTTNEANNKDLNEKKPSFNNQLDLVTPNFNYKKLPEVIKLDKAPNNFNMNNNQKNSQNSNIVKQWPGILNLDQNGYPINNLNDYQAYLNSMNNQNSMNGKNDQNSNQNSNPTNSGKDFNSLIWQMMDPNQQQQQKNFFDALTDNIQQQQFLQALFNKQQFNNWLDNSKKNTAALSFLNYLNSKQDNNVQTHQSKQSLNPTKDQMKLSKLNNSPNDQNNAMNPNSKPINQLLNKSKNENLLVVDGLKTTASTLASVQASNLNKDRYVSYDFKQPFIQYNGKDDFYADDNEQDTNSAVIALILGLFITILLIVIVGFRMSSIKKRIQRRGGRPLAHDSEYLVNGMYL